MGKKFFENKKIIHCGVGTLGNPLFKYGDTVGFKCRIYGESEDIFMTGTVEIIDRYGTFEQNIEPSYDIMVDDFNGQRCLFKHIRESHCYQIIN